jgi:hypothetical protein
MDYQRKSSYPYQAGYKARSTSKEAADKINMQYPRLRFAIEDVFKFGEYNTYTADEVADQLNQNLISVRARITELNQLDILEDSGERRKNSNNRNVIAWIHKDKLTKQQEMFK